METTRPVPAINPITGEIASFIGSGINGNTTVDRFFAPPKLEIASFIGSGINGNKFT